MEDERIEKIRAVVGRFHLFGEYTLEDYDQAMRDIAEILE